MFTPPPNADELMVLCWLCGQEGAPIEHFMFTRECRSCEVTWISRMSSKDGTLPKVEFDYQIWHGVEGGNETLPYVDFSGPDAPAAPA